MLHSESNWQHKNSMNILKLMMVKDNEIMSPQSIKSHEEIMVQKIHDQFKLKKSKSRCMLSKC